MSILKHRKSKQERKSFYIKVIHRQIQQYIKNGSVGFLDLSNSPITKLPDNLTKVGYLDISYSNISELPENLTVNGSLYIRNTNVEELPHSLIVNGTLLINDTNIEELPKSLTVNGNLYCGDTPLSKKYSRKEIKEFYPNIKGNVYIH